MAKEPPTEKELLSLDAMWNTAAIMAAAYIGTRKTLGGMDAKDVLPYFWQILARLKERST